MTVSELESLASLVIVALGKQALYATVLFLIVAVVRVTTRSRFPRLQYGLWCLVLLRLVLPTGLASTWSARTILERAAPSSGVVPPDLESYVEARMEAPRYGLRLPWNTAWVLLWSFGTVSFAGLLVSKRRYCRRIVKRSSVVDSVLEREMVDRWRNLFAVRRSVKVASANEPLSPFTLGVFRPVIFLPASFRAHSSPAVIEAAIAHEMAHIKRLDDLRLLFTNLVRSFYFFHPVAWLCASRMGDECERICDEMVLSRGALSPGDYGRSLLESLQWGWKSPHSAASFGSYKRRITMRIQTISRGGSAKGRSHAMSLLTLLFLGAFLLPMAPISQSAILRHEEQPPVKGMMANPLPSGRVTSPFGERKSPFGEETEQHNGIDLAAPRGTEISAPADGVVEIAEKEYADRAELGSVIVIDHGKGIKTFFAHLEELAVEAGRRLSRGDVIGTVGTTGLSHGPHLHFEVWRDGRPEDPALWLGDSLHLPHSAK
jgi:beta-lactamase regulating signal transducer with metallopeptidase domain